MSCLLPRICLCRFLLVRRWQQIREHLFEIHSKWFHQLVETLQRWSAVTTGKIVFILHSMDTYHLIHSWWSHGIWMSILTSSMVLILCMIPWKMQRLSYHAETTDAVLHCSHFELLSIALGFDKIECTRFCHCQEIDLVRTVQYGHIGRVAALL